MDAKRLKKYARLIAQCGVNVQKKQDVFVQAALDQPDFVTMVVEECYKLGARKVFVDWSYQPISRLHARYRSLATLSELDTIEEARWKHMVRACPCRIFLSSEDPDGMKGINMARLAKAQQKKYPLIRHYQDEIENRDQWCIAAVPGKAWAHKIFPDIPEDEAVEKLWQAILDTSRVTDDPVQAWKDHNADLAARCAWLNEKKIRSLHYTASNGTDLTVGMIPEAEFKGGCDTNLRGITYNPNIPSEECFISPMKGQAEGIVYASLPLSYRGQLIEDFSIRFENGKAVEWHASKNEDLLGSMLTMDEGSAYLGECALVPYDSPVRASGLLFYNTLFDENAACHLAMGMGFADTIRGFQDKSLDECRKMGINDSMIHVDFMIGTADMDIDAILEDGSSVAVFRKGNWAF